ncbi:Uncharacterised protein [Sphingobacterium thalpophilum]|uniref:Uncharacterized protein n=1 Tax=Sphingobacterium thalpophilum TaxID=259 RepID=A0A4U9VS45_9SPHI|nr:Uncharacterised protein [Sphingobacterium thalpophilum]
MENKNAAKLVIWSATYLAIINTQSISKVCYKIYLSKNDFLFCNL